MLDVHNTIRPIVQITDNFDATAEPAGESETMTNYVLTLPVCLSVRASVRPSVCPLFHPLPNHEHDILKRINLHVFNTN